MADGVHACVCVYIYTSVLSWLNSRSAGTNYNEPRLVGRESAMFSFLCPVVYRPFYRGYPPPSRLATLEADLVPHPPPHPRHLPRPLLYSSPPESQWRYLRRDCPPHLLSHGICLQCEIRLRWGEKNFSFLKPGQKERLENLTERYLPPYCVRG